MPESQSLLAYRHSLFAYMSLFLLFPIHSALAYSTPYKIVDRRAIAGLWRLSPRITTSWPMKEFTVRPKQKPKDSSVLIDEDVLLMLKEDGSFHQYQQDNNNDSDTEHKRDLDASWKDFQKSQTEPKKQNMRALVKGIWDYRDGMLILAADRPDSPYPGKSANVDADAATQKRSKKVAIQDTLLEGRVVATYEESLHDNPVVAALLPNANANANANADANANANTALTSATNATTIATTRLEPELSENATVAAGTLKASTTTTYSVDTHLDAHLSVPKGALKVGKFFYPKTHPYFFDQPMFQPVRSGSFSLRQVLGLLNTQNPAAQEIEKFQRSDFYNKTFSLTSHPIVQRRPKGNVRWSIKYNMYVHDPLSKKAQEKEDEESARTVPIRVMQVQFHVNNTFSSVLGVGESILRGKFDIIGQQKDQLWMQVTRFGFGRSVSGSVYSEGRMLTQEDAKTYWGTIHIEQQSDVGHESKESPEATTTRDEVASPTMTEASNDKPERLEVKGSVIMGWGLEPMPVALFIMREVTELDALDYDEDDDDDEDEDEEEDDRRDGVDWSGAFQ
jgi:hypothetical protein